MKIIFSKNFKDILPLCICFALSASTSSLTVSASSLVGFEISSNKSLATLPISLHLIGTMLSGLPASILMKYIGRKHGFIIGTTIGIIGAFSAGVSIFFENFILFCFSTFCLGILGGFTQLYRFAAVDMSSNEFRSRAVSLVMLGGIIAGFIGPTFAAKAKNLFENAPFSGSYISIILLHLFVLIILLKIKLPRTSLEEKTGIKRDFKTIFFQPKFIVAILSSMIGYAVMAMIMTATPLVMTEYCGHTFDDAAFVIQWHIVGMYSPSFFTGYLIKRFGNIPLIISGILLNFICILINLSGSNFSNFWSSLIILGVGWNFMFISGTTMLTETYNPSEKALVQGVNDFFVFGSASFASLFAGVLQTTFGWQAINFCAVILLIFLLIAIIWYFFVMNFSKKIKNIFLKIQ